MNDTRNAMLAWVSSITSLFAAIDRRDVLTIISAVVLPVVFFTVGKTVDVIVQIYIGRRARKREVEPQMNTDGHG